MSRRAQSSMALLLAGAAVGCSTETVATFPLPVPIVVEVGASRCTSTRSKDTLVGVVRPAREFELVAPFGGRVVDLHVEVGDVVVAGQPIARIDDRDLAEDAAVLAASLSAARAEAQLASAEQRAAARNLRDVQRLVRRNAASRQELTEAKLQLETTRAARSVARARVEELEARSESRARRSGDAIVVAPWSGWIASRHTAVGATVARDAPMLRLVSSESVVAFAIEPSAMPRVDAEVIFTVETREGEPIGIAEEVTVAPEVDPASGMRFASARVDALGHALVAGQVVHVRATRTSAIARAQQ